MRVGDDGGGGAVFDGAAGVGPLGLAEDLDAGQMGRQLLEPDQRRVADAFEDGGSERFDGSDHAASSSLGCRSRLLRLTASANVRQLIKSNVWHLWQRRPHHAPSTTCLPCSAVRDSMSPRPRTVQSALAKAVQVRKYGCRGGDCGGSGRHGGDSGASGLAAERRDRAAAGPRLPEVPEDRASWRFRRRRTICGRFMSSAKS